MSNVYKELAKADIKEKRKVVISLREGEDDDKFIMAQQISVQEGSRRTVIFLKGAFHIDSLDGLYNIRDAINEAINKVENEKYSKNIKKTIYKSE